MRVRCDESSQKDDFENKFFPCIFPWLSMYASFASYIFLDVFGDSNFSNIILLLLHFGRLSLWWKCWRRHSVNVGVTSIKVVWNTGERSKVCRHQPMVLSTWIFSATGWILVCGASGWIPWGEPLTVLPGAGASWTTFWHQVDDSSYVKANFLRAELK